MMLERAVATGGAFFVVGAAKSRFVDERWWVLECKPSSWEVLPRPLST